MGAGHNHQLYRPGDTVVHRLPPQCKLVAVAAFVLVVVATPREWFWAFCLYTALLAAVAVVARVPLSFVLRRMVIEIPFVVFAVALPFIGFGERVPFLGASLSVEGLWS